jgi:hypothetical protein
MTWAVVILSVATVAAGILAAASRRKAAQLSLQLRRLMPFVIKTGVDPSVIAQAAPGFGWVEIMKGGDTSPGIVGRIGWCPCQNEYTVATNQIALNVVPANAAAVAPLSTTLRLPLQGCAAPATAFRY